MDLPLKIHLQLERKGYQGRIVSIRHLEKLRHHIETAHNSGLFDEEFYREHLTGFAFTPPDNFPDAKSLIVVAVKQPQVRFTFNLMGNRRMVTVPPTYLHAQETDREVEDTLRDAVESGGIRVIQATLPKKLLAVCSGLARYGRNNIAYVAGMGSFHRLAAFFSDLPCEEEDWYEPVMMPRCQRCVACIHGCPTGAIHEDQFLISAERCIVFHNERPADTPFPQWLDPFWHNCLVGCMHCQFVCPENRDHLGWVVEGAAFSEEETTHLVTEMPPERFPPGMVKKLEKWDLMAVVDILPRNLKALFH
jgi:epoxyqueuosine reductase